MCIIKENIKQHWINSNHSGNPLYHPIKNHVITSFFKLYDGIHAFLRLWDLCLSDSMSESICESEYSKLQHLTDNRPNLGIRRICVQNFIADNGPMYGDENEFLQKISKQMANKFRTPLAKKTKFEKSRTLDKK